MKNVLIVIGLGCAIYGGYLWLNRKKEEDDDCGCGCGGKSVATQTASMSAVVPAVNTDLMPDNAKESYDTSFNSIFIGRGQGNYMVGATSTEDANAGIVTETAV